MFAVSLALVAQEFKPGPRPRRGHGRVRRHDRPRRGLRPAGGRRPGGGDRLGVDLLPERPDRHRGAGDHLRAPARVARPERVPHRLGRAGDLLDRAVPAGVRAAARQRGGLGLDHDRLAAGRRGRAAGGLHRDPGPGEGADAARCTCSASPPSPACSSRRARGVGVDVRAVPLPHVLPAGLPRPRAARGRAALPAAHRDELLRRGGRRSGCCPRSRRATSSAPAWPSRVWACC